MRGGDNKHGSALWRPQIIVVAVAIVLCGVALVLWGTHRRHMPQPRFFPQIAHVGVLAAETPARPQSDCAESPCMALTFDDGPNATTTPEVLSVLEKYNTHATFFVVGSHIAGNEELLQRMWRDGDEVGNHSWDHPDLTKLSPEQIDSEVERTQAAVVNAGLPAPRLFRLPYGAVNPMVRSHIPLTIVSWNIDPKDWHARTPQDVANRVLAHARPGAIVDMHDTHQITADALPGIISSLEQKYHLVTVSDMLDMPAGQPGIFYSR